MDDVLELIAWKLAEIGGSNCGRDLASPNRFVSLDIATKFMYHQRAEDLLTTLREAGYEVTSVRA